MEEQLPREGMLVGGRYRVARCIGSGGMGAVFEAEDTVLGRRVALKILHRAERDDEQLLARFEREARAAARLNDPNVVAVSDFVRDDVWGPALVLELLVGESVMARLGRKPRLGEAEIVDIAVQALGALEHAHAAGMVHRDLKPSNLFLVTLPSGLVVTKLLDFGIVKLLEDAGLPKLTRPGAAIGTPVYMPPEQALGEVVDARADVYAMGAVLYEALLGRPPYTPGEPLRVIGEILGGPPIDLALAAPDVSPELAAVVTRALAHDRDRRYASASAMRAELRSVRLMPAGWRRRVPVTRIHEDVPTAPRVRARPHAPELPSEPPLAPPTPRPTPPAGATPPKRRTPWLVVGTSVLLVALAWLAWSQHAPGTPRATPPREPPRTPLAAPREPALPHGVDPPAPTSLDAPHAPPSTHVHHPRPTASPAPSPSPPPPPTPAPARSRDHIEDQLLDPFGAH